MHLSNKLIMPLLIISLLGNALLLWQRDQHAKEARIAFFGLTNVTNAHLGLAAELLTDSSTKWDDPVFRHRLAYTLMGVGDYIIASRIYAPVLDEQYARMVVSRLNTLGVQLNSAGHYGSTSVLEAAVNIGRTSEPVDPADRAVLEQFGMVLRDAGWPQRAIDVPLWYPLGEDSPVGISIPFIGTNIPMPPPDSALKPLADALEKVVKAGR